MSHPSARGCDLNSNSNILFDRDVSSRHISKSGHALRPAPRFGRDLYAKRNVCDGDGLSIKQRVDEYNYLYKRKPPKSWWGWDFFGTPSIG